MLPCFRSRTRNFGVRLFFCRVRRVLSVAGRTTAGVAGGAFFRVAGRAGEACCGRGLLPPVGTCGGGHRPGSCFPGLEPEMRRADSEEFGRVWKSRAWTMPVEARGGGGDNHRAPEKRTRRSFRGSARLVFVGIGFFFLFSPLPLSVVRDQKGCLRDPVSERQVAPPPQSGIRSLPGPDQNGRSSTSAGVEA